MNTKQFPVGGPRKDVYEFLRGQGFRMARGNDKEWAFGDNCTLLLYGSGSMATIYSHAGNFKGPLFDVVQEFKAKIGEKP